MLQAQQANTPVSMAAAGLQGVDPSLLMQQQQQGAAAAMMQNQLLGSNPAVMAMMAQQSHFLTPEALAMQSVSRYRHKDEGIRKVHWQVIFSLKSCHTYHQRHLFFGSGTFKLDKKL